MFDPFENYDFEGDGCTFWFDTWRGIDLTQCSVAEYEAVSAELGRAVSVAVNSARMSGISIAPA